MTIIAGSIGIGTTIAIAIIADMTDHAIGAIADIGIIAAAGLNGVIIAEFVSAAKSERVAYPFRRRVATHHAGGSASHWRSQETRGSRAIPDRRFQQATVSMPTPPHGESREEVLAHFCAQTVILGQFGR